MATAAGDPSSTVTLLRVRFEAAAPAGARILATFADPEACVAAATTLAPEALDTLAADAPAGQLDVLCVPVGCPDEAAWRGRAQAWLEAATGDGGPPIRVTEGGGSVVWRAGRAAILCPADRMEPALAAVTEFAWYEWQLRRIETEIAADWQVLEPHMPLAQEVRGKDLKHRSGLAAGTAQTLHRRLRYSRIERRLLAPAPPLGEAAVKLGRRLRQEADVEGRIETVDGQIETCEYVYELANQRMGEYRNFRREYVIEILILIILAFETALLIVDLRTS